MNKTTIPIIIVLLCSLNSTAQKTQVKTYTIKDVGVISIPTNMALADKDFDKDQREFVQETTGVDVGQNSMTFRQKAPQSKTYATVVISTSDLKPGAYLKMNKLILPPKELEQVNNQYRSAFERPNIDKVITWYGTTVESVNGYKALKIAYLRQIGNNPYVHKEMYIFFNYDKEYTITLSYRQRDEKLWKPLYAQILNSFKITNIR